MIAVVGGHLTPALAVIDELVRRGHRHFIFLGRRSSPEVSEIKLRQIPFLSLNAGKLPRHLSPGFFLSLVKIPLGFFQAFWYLAVYKPQLILSFGGYLALPVALSAAILRIPLVTHEQASLVGLTNRLISRLAAKVAISWANHQASFPQDKVVFTGNPIRQTLLAPPAPCPLAIKITPASKLIYFTGGHQGSTAINQALLAILPQLLKHYLVIHQTGAKDFLQFNQLKSDRYLPQPWFTAEAVSWCLHHANLVVARSGANTITELAYVGTPVLLIPLPKSAHNEQFYNAKLLQAAGTARILLQKDLTPKTLLNQIHQLLTQELQLRQFGHQAQALIKVDATAKLADLVEQCLS